MSVHRFGVRQRQRLQNAENSAPHILMMSATPIPRTLALVLHGTMVVSCIKALPPGRQPITTKVVDDTNAVALQHMYSETNKELEDGGRVYIVYPLIEESVSARMASVKSAEDEFKRLNVSFVCS